MFSLYSKIIDPLLEEVRVYFNDFSNIKQNDKVLDICCGTGDQAVFYSRKAGTVVGVDINPNMIRTAEQKKMFHKLYDVFFEVADASNLPFEDNFFDLVSVSLALHEVNEEMRQGVISEMKRVVKKGGKMMFADFTVPMPLKFSSFVICLMELFAGKRNFSRFSSFLDQGGLGPLLEKNGLEEETRYYLKGGLITAIRASKK